MYIVQVKSRLLQIEQYTWPKTLNRMSNLPGDIEHLPTVPVTFKVPDFNEKLENNQTWTSPSFMVIKSGYTTWLSVAFFKGRGIKFSFFFKRSYPFGWDWPQNAMFTLELLNQQYDGDHLFIPYLIDIKNCDYVNDVTIQYRTGLMSTEVFDKKADQYLKNGNVYLRISYDNSIYSYVEWFMRQYLNLTLSNYPKCLPWIIVLLIVIEFQVACEAQLKELGYFNETVS